MVIEKMGSGDDDPEYKKKQAHYQQTQTKYKLKMLCLVVITNLLTIYLLAGPSPFKLTNHPNFTTFGEQPTTATTAQVSSLTDDERDHLASLHEELSSTRSQLDDTHSHIADLHQQLNSTNSLVETLLDQLRNTNTNNNDHIDHDIDVISSIVNDDTNPYMNEEMKLAIGPHKLPLGYAPRVGSDEVYPSVGAGCLRYQKDLSQYMTYQAGGECPSDDVFAQRLMLRGCEPLPRRRCHPKSPAGYVDPTPFPQSLWTTPPDTSITWDPYSCKSYQCLVDRQNKPGFYDCKDCFNLAGREKNRWLVDNGALHYSIDNVLAAKPQGTVRIGLDIGGGSGTFAARMRERNITVITTSMNLDGPFNSFIASRGLVPIHVSVSERLPFFDNTLDIVHSMHVLSNWIPDAMLEFTLFDIYRVLRPGGLFWVDHFFCLGSQLNQTYIPMFDRVGFTKLRWNQGMKLDKGLDKNEWYFSALLEKPMT